MADCVVLGGINFSRIQAGQQRLVRFRIVNPGPSQMIINSIALNSWDIPFSLPHLMDATIFPIYLVPNTEYESIAAFHPTSEGKYSAVIIVSLSNARSQQINLFGECEFPTSPSQIIYKGHKTRKSDSPLTEHGTYFDYSPKPTSPLTTSPHAPSPTSHSTPHIPPHPPALKNSPATPYVKTGSPPYGKSDIPPREKTSTSPYENIRTTPYEKTDTPYENTRTTPYAKTGATPYLKTDHFYTRYNHIAGRAQNGWEEGGKELETGAITEVVPYLYDSAGNIIAQFESRISKLEQNVATLLLQTTLVNRPQLHSDEAGEGRKQLDQGYSFQTPSDKNSNTKNNENNDNITNKTSNYKNNMDYDSDANTNNNNKNTNYNTNTDYTLNANYNQNTNYNENTDYKNDNNNNSSKNNASNNTTNQADDANKYMNTNLYNYLYTNKKDANINNTNNTNNTNNNSFTQNKTNDSNNNTSNFTWSTLSNQSSASDTSIKSGIKSDSDKSIKSDGIKSDSDKSIKSDGNKDREGKEREKSKRDKYQQIHHTPYKPHSSSEWSDASDNDFGNLQKTKKGKEQSSGSNKEKEKERKEKREERERIEKRKEKSQIHHTPYKPHSSSEWSDTSDTDFGNLQNTKKGKEMYTTPYKPKREALFSSEEEDEELRSSHRETLGSWKNENANLQNTKKGKDTTYATPYKSAKAEKERGKEEEKGGEEEEEEGLRSSHSEILGSWKKGEMGDMGEEEENYDFDLVKSNSDRMYGGFVGFWKDREEERQEETKERKREDEPVRSGKPIPQSFIESVVSEGNGKDEDRRNLTEEDKALLKEMESSPTKNEGPSNWRDFITATPYAKNLPTLYHSPVPNTPLPKHVHFGDGYSSA